MKVSEMKKMTGRFFLVNTSGEAPFDGCVSTDEWGSLSEMKRDAMIFATYFEADEMRRLIKRRTKVKFAISEMTDEEAAAAMRYQELGNKMRLGELNAAEWAELAEMRRA